MHKSLKGPYTDRSPLDHLRVMLKPEMSISLPASGPFDEGWSPPPLCSKEKA